MKEYKVSEELLGLILRYLLTKPMVEVEQIVNLIRQSINKEQ